MKNAKWMDRNTILDELWMHNKHTFGWMESAFTMNRIRNDGQMRLVFKINEN